MAWWLLASSLDQIGPFTKDVEDCAIVLSAIAGHDPKDSTSLKVDKKDYTQNLKEGAKGMKIGVAQAFMGEGLQPEVRAAIDSAIDTYRAMGAEIVDVSFEYLDYALSAYYLISSAEASSNLARYDGIRYGVRAEEYADLVDMYRKTRTQGFGDEVKRRIMLGTYALSSGYYDAYYKKAMQVRTLIMDDFKNVFDSCDVLLTPTTAKTAFGIGEKTSNPLEMYLTDIYTVPVNIAGIPGISIPCGFDNDGMPIGMQLLGPVLSEEKILQAAYAFERETAFKDQKPKACIGKGGIKMEYDIVIGMEIHAELATKSKIFCSCSTTFGADENTHACPVCLGMPGVLPVLNEKVVEYAARAGLALNCHIANFSKMDRKNYFYPDLPKAYQTSQFDLPICTGGVVDIEVEGEKKEIGITRIHIEEDAGKLLHESADGTLVDVNRCGVPLIEIVTEPDIRGAEEARVFAEKIRKYSRICGRFGL